MFSIAFKNAIISSVLSLFFEYVKLYTAAALNDKKQQTIYKIVSQSLAHLNS